MEITWQLIADYVDVYCEELGVPIIYSGITDKERQESRRNIWSDVVREMYCGIEYRFSRKNPSPFKRLSALVIAIIHSSPISDSIPVEVQERHWGKNGLLAQKPYFLRAIVALNLAVYLLKGAKIGTNRISLENEICFSDHYEKDFIIGLSVEGQDISKDRRSDARAFNFLALTLEASAYWFNPTAPKLAIEQA